MMSPKVTISIPEDLHDKMQEWKKSLNFSRICQRCIREEIAKKELFKMKIKEDKTMEEIFRSGNFETPESQYHVGKELGFAYAKTSPYHEIKEYEKYAEVWDERDEEVVEQFHYDLDIISILLGLFGEPRPFKKREPPPGFMPLLDHFDRGFMEGVIEYINEECSGLESSKTGLEMDRKLAVAKDENEIVRILEEYSEKARNGKAT